MSDYNYLVELVAYDPGLPGTTTLRYSTKGHVTGPAETPANTFYDPRVVQPATIRRLLFSEGTTQGRSKVALGDLILANDDGELDGLIDYGVDGRAITIRRGLPGAAYPAGFPVALVTTMEQLEVNTSRVIVRLRDRQAELDKPLQATKYDGDNVPPDGLEGGEELKDKPKPVLYGQATNISPVPVNPSRLIYQLADGLLASVENVYDSGVSLKEDLVEWETQTSGYSAGEQINTATFGAGLYVTGGAAGKIFTSPTRVTWTSRTSGFGSDPVRRIRYLGAQFIAVGDNAKLSTSPDGITWTARTSSFAAGEPIYGVTFNGSVYVAVGGDGTNGIKIATSSDGITWNQQTVPTGWTTNYATSVAFGNSVFVVVGINGKLATSADGTSWTAQTNLESAGVNLYGLLFDGTKFLVGTQGLVGNADGRIHTSLNGITWTRQYLAGDFSDGWFDIAFGGGVYVAAGTPSRLAVSRDGFIWHSMTSGFGLGDDVMCAAHGDSGFMVAGEDATLHTPISYKTFASAADLEDDSLAPHAGTFGMFLDAAGSYIRLGAPPAGQVTADVTQGAAGSNRTAGQIWKLILERAGMVSGTDFSTSDITTLDTANSSVLGFYAREEMTAADALTQVAASVGAWWGADRNGVFRIQRLVAPSGSPVVTFTEADIKRGSLIREPTRDPGRGLPTWRSILRYAKNYTVQDSGLAGSVSAERRSELAAEWRETKDEDAAVQTKHLLAPEVIEETLLVTKANADTEVDRRQTLRGTRRDFFNLTVQLDATTYSLDMGDVIEIEHSRFGLSAGKLFRVVAVEPDFEREILHLGAWG
ncbi:MAG: hypothetical protein WEE89_04895 [Gemmatimonadota bacterium]